MLRPIFSTLILLSLILRGGDATAAVPGSAVLDIKTQQQVQGDRQLFLPMLRTEQVPVIPTSPLPVIPRVNVPFFESSFNHYESAIFWFGRVTSQENYADMRVGYTADTLHLHLNVFDRYIWHDQSPVPGTLTDWDSASLYLNMNGGAAFRFDVQVSAMVDQPAQAAYSKLSNGWQLASIPFIATSSWRGNSPNDDLEDRGWWVYYEIPFSSLGLPGAPPEGSVWKMGIKLHDRDDAAGSPRPLQAWPSPSLSDNPDEWGDLAFGLPVYSPPQGVLPGGTLTVRHKLDGAIVKDAMVGGGTVCGDGTHFWNEWGDTNYAGRTQVNVQNQMDVADWPCFSKLYLTFPIAALPPGKVILSAELTLHHFGNSGGGDYEDPFDSLIQVLTVSDEWEENTLTWNNAPPSLENVSRAWVEPVVELTDWRGIPRTWDISRAVSQAYQSGAPLRLALYSADAPMHTGKYFFSSKVDDYSAVSRPTLTIIWGNP